MGKKPIVSVTYENERISIKNSLPYLKCVLRLSCVVHGPIYGRFMSFLWKRFSLRGAILFFCGIHFKTSKIMKKISRRSEYAHSTKDKRIRLVSTCRKVPLVGSLLPS